MLKKYVPIIPNSDIWIPQNSGYLISKNSGYLNNQTMKKKVILWNKFYKEMVVFRSVRRVFFSARSWIKADLFVILALAINLVQSSPSPEDTHFI